MVNPQIYTELCPFKPTDIYPYGLKTADFTEEPSVTVLGTSSTQPKLVQTNVYTSRNEPRSGISNNHSQRSSEGKSVAGEAQGLYNLRDSGSSFVTPTKTTSPHTHNSSPHTQIHTEINQFVPENPNPKNPNSYVSGGVDEHQLSPQSPAKSGSSPSRGLQQVFQEEGNRMDDAARLASLVNSIEREMNNAGVKVSLSKFTEHLNQLKETVSDSSPRIDLEGEYVSVPDGKPSESKANDYPRVTRPPPQGTQRNWSSLFKAQAPSKSVRLEHYPELQKGKEAHISFDESQLEDSMGKHCLVGHFLDGKMPLPLLSATARTVWKDHGNFSIKQLGSCYLFEFEDEISKLAVLEGGPYFFSRRYLVLKEWKRMWVPSKIQPSTIPV